jgi:hypothetical protein
MSVTFQIIKWWRSLIKLIYLKKKKKTNVTQFILFIWNLKQEPARIVSNLKLRVAFFQWSWMWNSDFDDDLKDNAILEQKSYRSYSSFRNAWYLNLKAQSIRVGPINTPIEIMLFLFFFFFCYNNAI